MRPRESLWNYLKLSKLGFSKQKGHVTHVLGSVLVAPTRTFRRQRQDPERHQEEYNERLKKRSDFLIQLLCATRDVARAIHIDSPP